MKTSSKQISLFGEEKSTSYQVDSLANLIRQQEKDKEKTTVDISGQKCIERYKKSDHGGLLERMFVELLVGTKDWFSMRCVLNWKMKVTKSSRLYFQLQASTPRTKEKESSSSQGKLLKTQTSADSYSENLSKKEQVFGNSGTLAQEVVTGFIYQRGLLQTPTSTNIEGRSIEAYQRRKEYRESIGRTTVPPGNLAEQINILMMNRELLPTPIAQEIETPCELTQTGRRMTKDGKDSHSLNIGRMASMGMLPTPVASDVEGGISDKRQIKNKNGRWVRVSDNTGTEFGAKLRDVAQMLPTPVAGEYKHGKTEKYWENRIEKGRQEDLSMKAYKGTLPTPIAGDWKGQLRKDGTVSMLSGKATLGELPNPNIPFQNSTDTQIQDGKPSQLNPLFVAEMMGFPPDWTILPFQNGEKNPLEDTETQ